MAKYRLKRKTYGVVDAVGNTLSNTVGGIASGVGKAADSKLGGLAGAVGGMSLLGSMGLPFGIGHLASAALGAATVRGVGKGLKAAGQNLQN